MFPPYSFQLALFFFISGMLFKDKYLDNVAEYFSRRIKSLLVPYFAYEAVYLLITFAMIPLIGEFFGEYHRGKFSLCSLGFRRSRNQMDSKELSVQLHLLPLLAMKLLDKKYHIHHQQS